MLSQDELNKIRERAEKVTAWVAGVAAPEDDDLSKLLTDIPALLEHVAEVEKRSNILRNGLIAIAGTGCTNPTPFQLCDERDIGPFRYCLACKAALVLQEYDKAARQALARKEGV